MHSGRADDVSAQRHFRQIFDDHDNLPSERGLTVKLGADEERARARPTCGRPSPSSIRRRSMLSQWRDGAVLCNAYLLHGADAKRRTDNGPDALGRTVVAGRETLQGRFRRLSVRRRRRRRVENDRRINRRTFTVGIGALVAGACAAGSYVPPTEPDAAAPSGVARCRAGSQSKP